MLFRETVPIFDYLSETCTYNAKSEKKMAVLCVFSIAVLLNISRVGCIIPDVVSLLQNTPVSNRNSLPLNYIA